MFFRVFSPKRLGAAAYRILSPVFCPKAEWVSSKIAKFVVQFVFFYKKINSFMSLFSLCFVFFCCLSLFPLLLSILFRDQGYASKLTCAGYIGG